MKINKTMEQEAYPSSKAMRMNTMRRTNATNKNVKIAKQLLKLAKALVAGGNFLQLKDTDKIKFSDATDSEVKFRIDVTGEYTWNGKDKFKGEHEMVDFFVEGKILKEDNGGKQKYRIKVEDFTASEVDGSLADIYSRPEYGMVDFAGQPGEVGNFGKEWQDVSKIFPENTEDAIVRQWIMKNLNIAVEIAEECATEIAKASLGNQIDDMMRSYDPDLIDDFDFDDDH